MTISGGGLTWALVGSLSSALAVIGLDQLSKTWAVTYFHQSITLNTVGAGSLPWLGAQPQGWLWGGGVILVGLILWAVYQLRQFPHQWFAWGLLWGGGVSNWLDRWHWQGVRDWLNIPGTGLKNNLADYALTLGVILLIAQWGRPKNLSPQVESS